MANLVYLISSLPTLTFGQPPPISLSDFHREAEEQLSSGDFRKLANLDLRHITETESGVLKRFVEMSKQVQEDIVKIRRSRTAGGTPDITTLPKAILEKNPLQQERSIMEWQWEQLSNIEWGETFRFEQLLCYKLKLQILERKSSFKATRGLKIYESVIDRHEKVSEEPVKEEQHS